MTQIEVPATSANIGPGFDCLGIALSLSNIVRIEKSNRTTLRGCPPQWSGKDNLFVRSLHHACSLLGISTPEISVEFVTNIPPARGLGSSASLAVAGAAAALLLHKESEIGTEIEYSAFLHRSENLAFLLRAATDIEGHPDNAAPAAYGGFTAAARAGQELVVSHSDAPADWHFVACVPEFDLETSAARKVLPDTYSRADAVHALSHAVLTAIAIQRADLALLGCACEDRLHEPYRRALVHDFEIVESACRAQHAAAVWLSGSGPTIMAVFEPSAPKNIEKELASIIAGEAKHSWNILGLHADNQGIRAQRVGRSLYD
jgi:homoserine kinase